MDSVSDRSDRKPNVLDPQWQFEKLGSPFSWLRHAQLLKDSADILLEVARRAREANKEYDKVGVWFPDWYIDQSVVQYLCALSLENLLKAIILAKKPQALTNGKLQWPGDGHRLDALVSQAGVSYESTYERQLISKQLQQFLNWSGRYPIPKGVEKLSSWQRGYVVFQTPEDFGRVFNRFRDILLPLLDREKAEATQC